MAEIPINYLKYIDQDGTEKKVYPITVTDAVYDSDGNKLSNVLLGVLKDTDISNVQSDSTTTVPSSALLKATDDKIGDTSSLPGESSNVVSAITQLNSDLNDRTAVADLKAIADVGNTARRIVHCNQNTLNTPYKAGLTGGHNAGVAYVNSSSENSATILYVAIATNQYFSIKKVRGVWDEDWVELLTNADLDGILYNLSDGSTGIEAGSESTKYRLQLVADGRLMLFKSTDGGSTWPTNKVVNSI